MIKKFEYCETVDIPRMQRLLGSMQELLEALDEGLVPDRADYTEGDFADYLKSLVQGQRGSLGRTSPGSWAVAPDDSNMDADARVEFIFQPTYLATATLARGLCENPLLALGIPGFREALQSGMKFCSHRALAGHGYEADEGAIIALRALSLGRVPWLLNRHPEFCPELKTAIDDVARDMAERLAAGTATGGWAEDYSEEFRSAIETLRLKNDPDFMRSLAEARQDPTKLSEGDLPW